MDDLGGQHDGDLSGLAEYVNVPRSIGAVVSARLATYAELGSVLSLEDVYDLLEVMEVDAYNRRLIASRQKRD